MSIITQAEVKHAIKCLPPLNMVVQRLLEMVRQPETTATDIARVLSGDEVIASKVLELVNSSFYGLSGRVSTVSRAVVILGSKAIHNLAMAFSTKQTFSMEVSAFSQEAFWSHSVASAATAQVLAKASKHGVPEEAFIAGLLHDVGLLILAKLRPDEMCIMGRNGTLGCRQVEQQMLGYSHTQLASMVFREWHFPATLIKAIENHHSRLSERSPSLAKLVAVADGLSPILTYGEPEMHAEEHLMGNLAALGIPCVQMQSILDDAAKAVNTSRQFLGIEDQNEEEGSLGSEQSAEGLNTLLLVSNPDVRDFATSLLRHHGHQVSCMNEPPDGPVEMDLTILGPDPSMDALSYGLQCHASGMAVCMLQPALPPEMDDDEDYLDTSEVLHPDIARLRLAFSNTDILSLGSRS